MAMEDFPMGYFLLRKTSDGQFMFNLHSDAVGDEIIATSERYKSTQAALNGIESVRKNAPDAEIRDETKDD